MKDWGHIKEIATDNCNNVKRWELKGVVVYEPHGINGNILTDFLLVVSYT